MKANEETAPSYAKPKRAKKSVSDSITTVTEKHEIQVQRLKAVVSGKASAELTQITCSRNAYDIFASYFDQYESRQIYESFAIAICNRANRVLSIATISNGGTTGTCVDLKIIMKHLLLKVNAECIMLCHNHPSGNLSPSQADLDITRKIKEACKMVDMRVIDHIILSGDELGGYLSFADEGYL